MQRILATITTFAQHEEALRTDRFDEVMTLLADRLARPGRVVWRFIHVDRPLPAALTTVLRIDRELGAKLRKTDRFPFYGIVPAEVS